MLSASCLSHFQTCCEAAPAQRLRASLLICLTVLLRAIGGRRRFLRGHCLRYRLAWGCNLWVLLLPVIEISGDITLKLLVMRHGRFACVRIKHLRSHVSRHDDEATSGVHKLIVPRENDPQRLSSPGGEYAMKKVAGSSQTGNMQLITGSRNLQNLRFPSAKDSAHNIK